MKRQSGCLHGTDPDPLQICDSFISWSSCGTPKVGAGSVIYSFAGIWDPSPHVGLLCRALIQGGYIVILQFDMPCSLLIFMGGLTISE